MPTAIGLVPLVPSLPSAQAPIRDTARRLNARSTLVDVHGWEIRQAYLEQTLNGVLLTLTVSRATPGVPALHLHVK